MKTWFISITVSIVFSVIGFGAISKPGQYDTGSAPRVPGKALVQIVRTWERQSGSARVRVEEMSLGTVIGPHRILTHNHFTGGVGTQSNETLSIVDQTGRVIPQPVATVKAVVLDKGTLLLDVPATLTPTAAVVADPTVLAQLTPDTWLTVNFWDDANNRFATKSFQILQRKGGSVMLADPEHVINSGDSGGSVYFEGRLIGNTWSINTDVQGNALGSLNVALVPAQVAAVQ